MSEDNNFYTISIYARRWIDEKQTSKNFRGTKKTWDSFVKPGLKMAAPLKSAAVATKTKNPQPAQIMSSILKSLTSGKILSLTDMDGRGLRLKVI